MKNILLLLDDSDPHRSGAVHYHELEDRRFVYNLKSDGKSEDTAASEVILSD